MIGTSVCIAEAASSQYRVSTRKVLKTTITVNIATGKAVQPNDIASAIGGSSADAAPSTRLGFDCKVSTGAVRRLNAAALALMYLEDDTTDLDDLHGQVKDATDLDDMQEKLPMTNARRLAAHVSPNCYTTQACTSKGEGTVVMKNPATGCQDYYNCFYPEVVGNCPNDLLPCPNNQYKSRNPTNGCEFNGTSCQSVGAANTATFKVEHSQVIPSGMSYAQQQALIQSFRDISNPGSPSGFAFLQSLIAQGYQIPIGGVAVTKPPQTVEEPVLVTASGEPVRIVPQTAYFNRDDGIKDPAGAAACSVSNLPQIRSGAWSCSGAATVEPGKSCYVMCWSSSTLMTTDSNINLGETLADGSPKYSTTAICQPDFSFRYNTGTTDRAKFFADLYCATSDLDDRDDAARSTAIVGGILALAICIMCTTCFLCIIFRRASKGEDEDRVSIVTHRTSTSGDNSAV